MGTPKHTPGPWYPHCAKADHCLSSSVWGPEPGIQVAVIGGKKLEEMNANAHLIAAAPAMYEALKELVAYLQDHVADEVLDNWAPVLKAACALAQAEAKS